MWNIISHKSEIPTDRIILTIFKGRISLTEYDIYTGRFSLIFDPAMTGSWQISQDMESCFYAWMELPDYPSQWYEELNAILEVERTRKLTEVHPGSST